jgi:hypothetical protein
MRYGSCPFRNRFAMPILDLAMGLRNAKIRFIPEILDPIE